MGIFGRRKGKESTSKDPVCGMMVVEAHAVGPYEAGAETYYFCSTACQESYQRTNGPAKGRRGERGIEA